VTVFICYHPVGKRWISTCGWVEVCGSCSACRRTSAPFTPASRRWLPITRLQQASGDRLNTYDETGRLLLRSEPRRARIQLAA